MSHYAAIIEGIVANVAVCDDPDFAKEQGWIGPIDTLDPQPGVGWSYDGTNWTAPSPPPLAPQQEAAQELQQMAATDIHIFGAQLQADIAAVTSNGWAGLSAQQQHDIMLRMLNGFGAAMTAIQTHAVATGTIVG
jgi:hypothetical protein